MSELVVKGTPVELRDGVWVKREDLCSPDPGPSFSKIRGVEARIRARPERVIGCLDTYHSKAGWAVAYVCAALGRQAVVDWPKRKADPGDGEPIRESQLRAAELGASLEWLPAGRSAILYHHAKRDLAERAGHDGYMMPNALKLSESVDETAAEVVRTELPEPPQAVVVSASSGTIAAGVVRGFAERSALFGEDRPELVIHLGYSRSKDAVRKYLEEQSGVSLAAFPAVRVIDDGFGYGDAARGSAPFPCNPYYDLKAWSWLMAAQQVEYLPRPILFWNVGA